MSVVGKLRTPLIVILEILVKEPSSMSTKIATRLRYKGLKSAFTDML